MEASRPRRAADLHTVTSFRAFFDPPARAKALLKSCRSDQGRASPSIRATEGAVNAPLHGGRMNVGRQFLMGRPPPEGRGKATDAKPGGESAKGSGKMVLGRAFRRRPRRAPNRRLMPFEIGPMNPQGNAALI